MATILQLERVEGSNFDSSSHLTKWIHAMRHHGVDCLNASTQEGTATMPFVGEPLLKLHSCMHVVPVYT
eukprot:5881948-Amphidinium_carterae.3